MCIKINDFKKDLGIKLRFHRLAAEYPQEYIARLLNIDRSTYTYYETGKSLPDVFTLLKICKILDIDYRVLLDSIASQINIERKLPNAAKSRKRKTP